MQSISTTFNRASVTHHGLSPLAVMFWIVAIDDDRQRHEKERRRKREQAQQPRKPKRPAGPSPF